MTSTLPAATAAFIEQARERVERALDSFLPAPPACPPALHEAMRYSLVAGGKRLRPLLVLAAADAASRGEPDAVDLALPAACAIEWIHTYSLVHDDLPAMDDDTLRRGRPTSHVVFGEGLAILAGDGLLTEAFALLAREPAADRPEIVERKLETLAVIARAAGATGMVGGQAVDLAAAAGYDAWSPSTAAGRHEGGMPPLHLDARQLEAMHAMKTGALIRAAATAGAIMAGAIGAVRAAVADFATHLGLAFQIVDDVLDVEGAAATLGKTAGKDAAAGKPTYPALFGLDESKRLAQNALARALDALARAGLDGHLGAIARSVVDRTS